MKITTTDIIKFLPFEKNFQADLIKNFDTLDPNKKFALEQVIWDAYEAIYKLRLEENIRLALLNAKDSNIKMDENFYNNMKAETVSQMETEFSKGTAKTDISQIRAKLEEIMKQPK
jgi:hypothetical protein